ncbi:MAG: hypothetical protein HYV09_10950 [Deltaproteobacteria bacterium]|nr:hypothetical protein [Deltaproteobacteria bacterium]
MRRWILLCLAPLLVGGMCGSVLRRYDPVGWEYGSSGFKRRVGDLDIELSGLVRQTGRLGVAIANRGTAPVELRGVELRIDDEREVWAPPSGPIRIEPGARAEADVGFNHALSASKCQVVLQLSSGDVPVDLEIP